MPITVVGNIDLIPLQTVCLTCKSILEYFPPDVKIGYTEELTPKQYYYITCPVCIKNCGHAPKAAERIVENPYRDRKNY